MLADIFREEIELGAWPGELNSEDTALAINTMLEGASLWVASDPNRGQHALAQLEKWLRIDL